MNTLKAFRIPFAGLGFKVHQFQFEIEKSFFTSFDDAIVEDCDITVTVDFDKRETFFHLKFYIDGTVNVACDRCLTHYDQAVFGDYELFVKFADDPDSMNEQEEDDVIYISRNEDHLDISKVIYDYIVLSIPLRCVHPDDENEIPGCDPEFLEKLGNKTDKSADPRWAALEKLRNKK